MKRNLAVAALVMLIVSIAAIPVSWADVSLASATSSGVIARITPLASDTGTKKIRTCAMISGALYCRIGSSLWVQYDGVTIPVADQRVLLPSQEPFDFQVTNLDVSALVGADIYVCYGADENECLNSPGHVAKVYTVPAPTSTSPPPTATAPAPTVLHYSEKVIALWTGAYPYAVTKTGVTKLANKTQYTAGFYPLFNCWIAERPQTDGKIPLNCQDAMSLNRHLLYIDPVAEEVHEIAGGSVLPWDTTPVGNGVCGWCRILDYPAGVTWEDVPLPDSWAAHPGWYAIARVTDGWYFAYTTPAWVLNFQADTGAVTVVTPGTTFTDNGSFRYIGVYNN